MCLHAHANTHALWRCDACKYIQIINTHYSKKPLHNNNTIYRALTFVKNYYLKRATYITHTHVNVHIRLTINTQYAKTQHILNKHPVHKQSANLTHTMIHVPLPANF